MSRTVDEMSLEVGTKAHAAWRNAFAAKAGNTPETPRIKKTTDAAWSAAHGGAKEIDIAHTDFADLPADWQGDNRDSGRLAVELVLASAQEGGDIRSPEFMENASSAIHDVWLARHANDDWKDPACFMPYGELSEPMKDLDREFVRLAIAAYEAE